MNNEEKLAPIVLFTYNRPWHTRQTVEALQKNELASESELFIYSDAPKSENAEAKVNEVREYIKTIDGFNKITIIERDKNWGLANSIIDGVTKIINEYGKIIVLEDDLVTSPYFLRFMNSSLSFYEDNNKVGSVTGYIPYIDNLPDLYFLKFGASLGWGTWKRVWGSIEFDTNTLIFLLNDKKRINEFNMDGAYDYYAMLNLQQDKKIDSWAIRFAASLFLQNLLHLRVGKSLVQHIGSDSGTHCNNNTRTKEEDGIISYVPIQYIAINIEEDTESYRLFKKFYKRNKKYIFIRIINKIKRIIKG